MKLNIYKDQKNIEKTYEVDEYDIMYGTVEDIFDVLDGMEDMKTDGEILKLIQANRKKLNGLLLDIFDGLTEDELRHIKIKELVPLFLDLFEYVKSSFGKSEKN
jgi:hypothetical protein